MLIYKITNLVNGKAYIGQTIQANPKARWYSHWDYVRKYGIENFSWEVVDRGESVDHLNELETVWANKLRDQGIILYNNRETGGNKKHSAESIERMSVAQKLRHQLNPAGGWTRVDGGPMKGKMHSEETRKLMSQSAHKREARKKGEL